MLLNSLYFFYIVKVLCYNERSNKNVSSYSGGSNTPLVIVLQNGKEYTFDNAHVVRSVDNGSNFVLELDDGSKLNVTADNVDVKPGPNSEMEVGNVKNSREENGNLILDLENGDQMVIKDPQSYEDKGDGKYDIKTGENTEITTEPNNEGSVEAEDDEGDDDDVSSSSAASIICISSLLSFACVCIVM